MFYMPKESGVPFAVSTNVFPPHVTLACETHVFQTKSPQSYIKERKKTKKLFRHHGIGIKLAVLRPKKIIIFIVSPRAGVALVDSGCKKTPFPRHGKGF